MNRESIDTTNMCSHLQKKLFEEDGLYHGIWVAIQDDPEVSAVVRSRRATVPLSLHQTGTRKSIRHSDTNRLYTTGQSMGGMMSFYFNITHPDLFVASLFVSSQWDTSKMQDFGKKNFFYIVAGGDQKAYDGMQDLTKVLKENDARIESASWSAKLSSQDQERLAEQLIARGSNINFILWETGSVLPESGKGMEHMASFDYGYKIAAVRDWLYKQSKQ